STDTSLAHAIGNTMRPSVPAQTDQTDRQIGAQAAGQPLGFAAVNLSGDLSRPRTDDGQSGGDPWAGLGLPPFLCPERFVAAVDADGDGEGDFERPVPPSSPRPSKLRLTPPSGLALRRRSRTRTAQ